MEESFTGIETKRSEGLKRLNYPFLQAVYAYSLTAFNQCGNPELMNFLFRIEEKYIDELLGLIKSVDTITEPGKTTNFLKKARTRPAQGDVSFQRKLNLLNLYQKNTNTNEVFRIRILILTLCSAVLQTNFPAFYQKLLDVESELLTNEIYAELYQEAESSSETRKVSWRQRFNSYIGNFPERRILYTR